jgi:hypothetical protein
MTLSPELGTADPFVTLVIHQICCRGAGEAIALAGCTGWVMAKLQWQSELFKAAY